MYTLYYFPGACSLATHVVLNELKQKVSIIDVSHLSDFSEVSILKRVPVLIDGDNKLTEGAAIMFYLLNKHDSSLIPTESHTKQKAIQDIMFANASMHPAYSTLFFIDKAISGEPTKQAAFNVAAESINLLWVQVENTLSTQAFLGGTSPSAADIMLAVYATWGQYFPVDIQLGDKTSAMVAKIYQRPSFVEAVAAQKAQSAQQ